MPVDEALPVLSTKLGGVPDLPPGQAWPVASDGAPLQFVLQLNLTDLASRFEGLLPWPAGGGVVQLFTDGDSRGDAVLVHRDLSGLRPAESPAPVVGEYRLDPAVTFTFPDDATGDEPFWALRARLEQESPELKQLLDKWQYLDRAQLLYQCT
ncbi:DUF1963 domain-containing protein [Dactylosporangium sp. NPDC049525]|uniref:DUF1963 domain-containing protein n=1 Tax=Dactylosporangium sp. NPDC049525 TaxID=3154730 RepID=UPI00341F2F84